MTCPASFLPWLASWMDFGRVARGPEHLSRAHPRGAVKDEETRAFIEELAATHEPAHAGYILEMASWKT